MKRCDVTSATIDDFGSQPVAVIGYGNQGRAHALNLRDAGADVLVGQRPGHSFDTAVADDFAPVSVSDAVTAASLIILTLPDERAAEVYAADIEPALKSGHTLGFVHGFNIRYGFINPPQNVDCIMIAPKGPGTLLRSLYVDSRGMPALLAIHQDATGNARRTALAWAAGIGATRAGVVETTFAAETECDLFGEQTVLCGGVTALMKAAFDTLVDAGYEPELAYIECVHELKQVVDLIYEGGISHMRRKISNTAEYGDLTRGPIVVDKSTRARMRQILAEIQDGTFAREWMAETAAGMSRMKQLHDADKTSPIEDAGRAARSLMPWLQGDA